METATAQWTSARWTQFALKLNYSKSSLEGMLNRRARQTFRDKCAEIEIRLTKECEEAGHPCLESGCAFKEENREACLNACLSSDTYNVECAMAWADLFVVPSNRV